MGLDPVDVSTFMVLTRKRGIELKENFNFWGKAKTVGHEDILFCQLIHENGYL